MLGGEILDLLEQRHELVGISQQDGVELGEPGGGGLEQRLRLVHGVEPALLQEPGDLRADLVLLGVEAALPAVDAADEVEDRDAKRTGDALGPVLRALGAGGGALDLRQLTEQRAREERQALAGEGVVVEEGLGDVRREAGECVLARAGDAGGVDAQQESLFEEALDGVGGALARLLGARVYEVADLLEEVDEQVVGHRGQALALAAKMQPGETAEVEGSELQTHGRACERSEQGVRVGW